MVEVSIPNVPPAVKQTSELLEKIILSFKGGIRLARANVEKYPNLANSFRITHVPTFFIVFQGKIIGKPLVGPQVESTFRKIISLTFEDLYTEAVTQLFTQADQFLTNDDIPSSAKLFNQVLTEKNFFFCPRSSISWVITVFFKREKFRNSSRPGRTYKIKFS